MKPEPQGGLRPDWFQGRGSEPATESPAGAPLKWSGHPTRLGPPYPHFMAAWRPPPYDFAVHPLRGSLGNGVMPHATRTIDGCSLPGLADRQARRHWRRHGTRRAAQRCGKAGGDHPAATAREIVAPPRLDSLRSRHMQRGSHAVGGPAMRQRGLRARHRSSSSTSEGLRAPTARALCDPCARSGGSHATSPVLRGGEKPSPVAR